MDKLDIGKLGALYNESEVVDKSLFAEQRSNILLVAGEHYNRKGKYGLTAHTRGRVRNNSMEKIRLVKNHTHKVHRRYVSSILNYASSVAIVPQIESEMQDRKSAELNQSVLSDAKVRYKLREKIRRWASDFVSVGEVAVKIFWDSDKGKLTHYNQALDEEGVPLFHTDPKTGELVETPDKNNPEFSGEFVFERIFGFNLLRDPAAKEMDDSEYFIVRKMMNTKKLKGKYRNHPDILKSISEGENEEYVVFDSNTNGYSSTKDQTPVREYYFRPCRQYPRGYYYITTKTIILDEGELPFGVFPIAFKAFDENQTSPRGRSMIKQVKPYQAEINRSASAEVRHQLTVGDDKILYSAGTKLNQGTLLPGVRGITYQGLPPQVMPGRDGSQFRSHRQEETQELYEVTDTLDINQGKNSEGQDMYAMLFRSAKQRQQLSIYSEKFEEFLVDVVTKFLELAKHYYTPQMLIPAIGRKEYVNIEEFKNTQDIAYQIKVVPQDDTLETQFGKQLTFQHLLQYAGHSLGKEDIGMLMRSMPFANKEEMFNEYTIEHDSVKNMILALDRGQPVQSTADDNHDYVIRKLTNRMRMSDFNLLDPHIQQMYMAKRQEHQQLKAQKEQHLLAMKSQYIPADGPMIGCDMYVEADDPSKAPKRARIPQRALDWLVRTLEAQHGSLQQLSNKTGGELEGQLQQTQPQEQAQPGQMSEEQLLAQLSQ